MNINFYSRPVGLVKSSDNMFMSIGVPSNSYGYYILTLQVGSASLRLVFYYIGGKIEYSWRELVLSQLEASRLTESSTSYSHIKNIIDPINDIVIYISQPNSSASPEYITRFKVLRVFEPANQPQTYSRLMLDGDNAVVWREQMGKVPVLLMTDYVNSAIVRGARFPFFGNYNPGVNMITSSATANGYLRSELVPLEYGEDYTLAFKLSLAAGDDYDGSTDSYIELLDEDMQVIGSIDLEVLEDSLTGAISNRQMSEDITVEDTRAKWGRVVLQTTSGDSITVTELHFGKVVTSDTTFDPSFDATFTAIANTIIPTYAPNPLAAQYNIGQYTGIGVTIDMNAIEVAIGKQTRLTDGIKGYPIKETPRTERLIWLCWTNSYGVKQWMPLTGLASVGQESWREVDYNKFDAASGRYISMQRRHDSVDTLSASVGFDVDYGTIRSLLESDEVEVYNRAFTCSARCIVTCDSLDRTYHPTEPESTLLTIQLMPNNILL